MHQKGDDAVDRAMQARMNGGMMEGEQKWMRRPLARGGVAAVILGCVALFLGWRSADRTPQIDRPVVDPAADVLVVGDSMMWWNSASGQGVADVLAAQTGLTVSLGAVPAAQMTLDAGTGWPDHFDIRMQVPNGGDWRWVAANGGINDMGHGCGCEAQCAPIRDALVNAAGDDGEIVAFVRKLRSAGHNVILVGYLPPSGEASEFHGCAADLSTIASRLSAFATKTSGVVYLDASVMFAGVSGPLYNADGVHPSVTASAAMAQAIAAEIAAK